MNKKGFANIILAVLIVALVGLAGYFLSGRSSSTSSPLPPVTNGTSTNWQSVDADYFTLSLPPGWKFNKLGGEDSYIGEFVGDGMRLKFDYGWYSNSLVEDSDPNYTVTYETIDGYQAKIVVPKVTGNGITGIYFDNLGSEGSQQTNFNIYGENFSPSQQETVLKIFRTLKIVKRSMTSSTSH